MPNKIWHKELSVHCKYTIGKNCTIHAPVWIGDNVVIGDNVKIEPFVFIPEGVTIGDNVFVGPGTVFTNDKKPPSGRDNWKITTVCRNVSIGANCTILPGIVIGQYAMIGAGSVVTKDVYPFITVVGNPATEIKYKI